MVFAFSCLATLVGARPLKTIIGVVIGLMLATIGIDSATGVMRFTMGIPNLFDGMEFLIVVIGLFAISEALLLPREMDADRHHHRGAARQRPRTRARDRRLSLDEWRVPR